MFQNPPFLHAWFRWIRNSFRGSKSRNSTNLHLVVHPWDVVLRHLGQRTNLVDWTLLESPCMRHECPLVHECHKQREHDSIEVNWIVRQRRYSFRKFRCNIDSGIRFKFIARIFLYIWFRSKSKDFELNLYVSLIQ